MIKRAFSSVEEAHRALAARGLYPDQAGGRVFRHPRVDYPFYVDFRDAVTDRDRGIIVDSILEDLEMALEAAKEMP